MAQLPILPVARRRTAAKSRKLSLVLGHSQSRDEDPFESTNIIYGPIFCFFSVEEAHVIVDSAASANHQATPNNTVPTKGSGKKQKTDTDKGMIEGLLYGRHSAVQ